MLGSDLMMSLHNLLNDGLGKIYNYFLVDFGILRKISQPGKLPLLPLIVDGRQTMHGLQQANFVGAAEALGEDIN